MPWKNWPPQNPLWTQGFKYPPRNPQYIQFQKPFIPYQHPYYPPQSKSFPQSQIQTQPSNQPLQLPYT